MRKLLLTGLAFTLVLSGCNWSNEDLIFLAALPSKDVLEARVPAEDGAAEQGLGQRRDGLSLNGPSVTYERTRNAAREFNGGLLKLLGIIETVKTLNPSKRAKDSRTWGPFRDQNNPDREARVVITRVTDESGLWYQWVIEGQKLATPGWVTLVSGSYLPNAEDDVTRGVGDVLFDAAQVREDGFAAADDDEALQSMEVRYATDGDPVHVEIDFAFLKETFFGAEDWALHYVSDEFADQSGSLQFEIVGDFHKTLSDKKETLTILARWAADGAGRADATVSGGDLGTATPTAGSECWDAGFRSIYVFEHTDYDLDGNGIPGEYPAPEGEEAACAFPAP